MAGLAKWLRLLGFDTSVYTQEAGRPMMRLALQEGRIVLTRRRDMRERQFSGQLCLVPEMSPGRQLKFIIDRLSLKIIPKNMYSICLVCNRTLRPVSRGDVRDAVPEFVFENCHEFNRCEGCGKVFWQGTHVRNALEFLKQHEISLPPDLD